MALCPRRILFIGSLCLLFFSSNIYAQSQKGKRSVKKPAISKKAQVSKEQKELNEKLQDTARLFRQADAVAREMWFVVAAERKVDQRSVFGKLNRASQMAAGIKVPALTFFSCDRYDSKITHKSGLISAEVFEVCNPRDPKLIAQWDLQKTKLEVKFFPANLADVIGLGASVLNKKMHCRLNLEKDNHLAGMECQNWTQDRSSNQIIDLTKFTYEAESNSLMEIKGFVLEDMNPTRKLESSVPKKGPIKVTETDIPLPGKKSTESNPGPTPPVPETPILTAPPLKPSQEEQGILPEADLIPYEEDENYQE